MKKFFWLLLMASLGGATSWAMNSVNVATITLGTPACLVGGTGSITISPQGGVPPYMISLNNSDFSYNKTLPTPNTPPYTVTFTDLPLVTNTDDGEGYYTYTITDSATPANTNTNGKNYVYLYPQDNPITLSAMLSLSCIGGSPTLTIIANGAAGGTYTFAGPTGTIDSGIILTSPQTFVYPNSLQTAPLTPGEYHFFIEGSDSLCGTIPFETSVPVNIQAPLESTIIVPTATVTNVSCFGLSDGSITVSGVTGGSGSYVYSIDGGTIFLNNGGLFTGLSAGMYSVVVQDSNFCQSSPQSVTVTSPSTITVPTPTVTNVTCSGLTDGTITVSGVTGGSGSYVYSIDGGTTFLDNGGSFMGLSAGMYSVVVQDSNFCQSSPQSVTVTSPSTITVPTPTVTNVSCFGLSDGSITVSGVTGGSGSYVYSIDGGTTFLDNGGSFTGLSAGMYSVVVQDSNFCQSSPQSVTVTSPMQVVINVTQVTSPMCAGGTDGSLSFSVSGGTPLYTAILSNGAMIENIPMNTTETFTDLAAGTYVITVNDANGCMMSSGSITLSPVDQINITVSPKSPTCSGGTNGSIMFTITNAVAPSKVVLKNASNMTVKKLTHVPNGVAETIKCLAAGSYSLTVTDSNGCSSTVPVTIPQGSKVMINAPSGMPMVSPILCYGGTATISFTVSGGTPPYQSCLYQDNQSRKSCIVCQNGRCNEVQSITGVPAGDYDLVVTDANGCSASVAVIVTQPQPFNFTIQTSTKSCPKNQSKLKVKATGGTAPYSYRLDGGAFQNNCSFGCVKNGKHKVSVKDANGCIKKAWICIPQKGT